MIDRRLGKIQVLRGTDLQRKRSVLEQGMFFYSIDKKRLYIGDGITQGGILVSNKNFIINSTLEASHPQAVYGDIIYNSYLNRTYIVNKNDTLTLLMDSNDCVQLQNRIISLSAILIGLKDCITTVRRPPQKPPPLGTFTWTKQPQSSVVDLNSIFILETEAVRYPLVAPITYRWVDASGISIAGANSKILTIKSVQQSDENKYACIAESTGITSITSEYASLTIKRPDGTFEWVTQPIGGTVEEGLSFIFTAEAVVFPVAPITYRWVDASGISIAGETKNELYIDPIKLSDANNYACIAESTGVESITSTYARLNVTKSTLFNLLLAEDASFIYTEDESFIEV
jgi:hypothetical protein